MANFVKLILATSILAASAVLHERRDVPLQPLGISRVDGDAFIPLRIGLRQRNLDIGYERLMNISHPSSPQYGKHLTPEDVHAIFAPADETIHIVKTWLLESGIEKDDIRHYENQGWLALHISASKAERLLSTRYYEHTFSDSIRLGCNEYHFPSHISPYIDFIKPGVVLSSPMRKRTLQSRGGGGGHRKPPRPHPGPPHSGPNPFPHWKPPSGAGPLPKDLQNCSASLTPVCIKALYDIPRAEYHHPNNTMGVYESYDAFALADLQLFFKHYAPWVPQGTAPSVIHVDGGVAPVTADNEHNTGESDLDIDLAYSLIYPQSVTVYQVDDDYNASGGSGKAGFMNTFLDSVDGSYCNESAFGITGDSPDIDATYPDGASGGYKGQRQCGIYKLTRVLSISYGVAEAEYPKPYAERVCHEIMKLGLQGHSLLVATGDYGVAGYPTEFNNTYGCISADGKNGTIYAPDFLSSCPYMTAVGATQLYPNQTVKDPESAMQVNFTALRIAQDKPPGDPTDAFVASHGGFSNYFPRPAYQDRAVSTYLNNHDPELPFYNANSAASNIGEHGGVYNRGGRGFPDVSANGAFQPFYNNLTMVTYYGTSLSSPIFGALLTLINEERTAIGKGPVGFVNPVLYEHPEVLNDITNGSNPNCGSSGFKASKGWDPVTGLGTPNYPKMLELFLNLP